MTGMCGLFENTKGAMEKNMNTKDIKCSCKSDAWKERMVEEYHFVKEKYAKLRKMIVKYEADTLDFEPTCPIELLVEQLETMGDYLHILEIRAEIEGVNL